MFLIRIRLDCNQITKRSLKNSNKQTKKRLSINFNPKKNKSKIITTKTKKNLSKIHNLLKINLNKLTLNMFYF